LREAECCALAGTDCRPTDLRRRAGRPQLKRDPLGGITGLMRRPFLVYLAVATATAACNREHAVPQRDASASPLAKDAASAQPAREPPIAVVQTLLPLLNDRISAYAEEFDSAGRWRGPSRLTLGYEARLASLLQRRDPI